MVYICINSKYKNDCSTILRPWTGGYLQKKFKVENVIYCDVFYSQPIKVPNPRSQMTLVQGSGLFISTEREKEERQKRKKGRYGIYNGESETSNCNNRCYFSGI